jgi:hypothetical protein
MRTVPMRVNEFTRADQNTVWFPGILEYGEPNDLGNAGFQLSSFFRPSA